MEELMQAQGLAQQSARPTSQFTVGQIVQMIVNGADPEDLLEKGVPLELIQQAMEMLMQQMQPANQDGGLAAMSAPMKPANV